MDTVKAREMALHAHRGQKYGDNDYAFHLEQVAHMVWGRTSENDYRSVGWLHDIVEDTTVTLDDLTAAEYSYTVVHAIDCMTKRSGEDYFDYLRRVKSNPIALEVKKCDTLCNLVQNFKENNSKRVKKYTEQLHRLYQENQC